MNNKLGGGSLTALPIINTQGGDVSAYMYVLNVIPKASMIQDHLMDSCDIPSPHQHHLDHGWSNFLGSRVVLQGCPTSYQRWFACLSCGLCRLDQDHEECFGSLKLYLVRLMIIGFFLVCTGIQLSPTGPIPWCHGIHTIRFQSWCINLLLAQSWCLVIAHQFCDARLTDTLYFPNFQSAELLKQCPWSSGLQILLPQDHDPETVWRIEIVSKDWQYT